MAIFALNIMPYISASIIVQLMTSVIPSFEALKKEGESGRKVINQYTRYITVDPRALPVVGHRDRAWRVPATSSSSPVRSSSSRPSSR